ncbi:MAG: alpha/beta hydrolase fold-containing protein [Solirubrobacterales bacterium]|nr:alpha/beta hydrolase fold-containing protein [Solirubrobacterales bacterium]
MAHLQAAGGALLHYDDEGTGPLVLLVHGGTGTGAYDWEYQREPLARRYRIVTPDLRGHGRSSDPDGRLGLEQIARDTLDLVDALGERPAAIVGFSFGATAILRLLCSGADVTDALVMIGASQVGRPQDVESIVNGPWPRELRALPHEHTEWRRLREAMARSWADELHLDDEELRRVSIPALVIAGDRDTIEPVETALALDRALPRGELLVLPGCGHFATRQRPAEVNVAIEGFLARHLEASR